jgi:RNA polymerase sigma-70 factor (ECF subfamily)
MAELPGPEPDADAETLLLRGDRNGAIAALMNKYGDSVFGYCIRLLGDRALAEDVRQQVFLEVCRDIASYRGQSSLRTWLFGIANHRCQDHAKSQHRREKWIQPDEDAVFGSIDPSLDPGERLERSRRFAALEDCMAQLSVDICKTIWLRFRTDMTYDEMAEVLRAKPDALHARVARALPILRQCLESKGWGHV